MLSAAGLSHLLVDTGIGGSGFVAAAELGVAASAHVREVVRLESVAERVASSGVLARTTSPRRMSRRSPSPPETPSR